MKNKKVNRKKYLITSITGQDESYLTEFLSGKVYEVQGIKDFTSSYNSLRL